MIALDVKGLVSRHLTNYLCPQKSEGILCIGKCIHRPPQRPTPPRHSEKILIQGQGVAEEMGHSEI